MTDKELDDLTVKLARQVTIKMCRQAADAIIDLRERIAALEKEQTELDKVRYDEIMALREQNGALSERIAALEAENSRLANDYNVARDAHDRRQSERDAKDKQLTSCYERMFRVADAITALRDERDILRSGLEATANHRAKVEAERDALLRVVAAADAYPFHSERYDALRAALEGKL